MVPGALAPVHQPTVEASSDFIQGRIFISFFSETKISKPHMHHTGMLKGFFQMCIKIEIYFVSFNSQIVVGFFVCLFFGG